MSLILRRVRPEKWTPIGIEELEEIPVLKASEQQVRDKVLDAHKVLMGMNSRNREEFKNLVRALECEETG